MAKRPVHWFEGMFLKPHHFQAADRFLRERIRESEDWLHPHDWGLKSLKLDGDATANYSFVLRACQARFQDGTTVVVPDEVTVDPAELRTALAKSSETTVYLAVPTLQTGRANVSANGRPADAAGEAGGPRYTVAPLECPDENTGSDEEQVHFRNVQARLLTSNLDTTGYELLPLARIVRAAAADAPPRIDPAYVPPILALEAWAPLHDEVRSLHEHIGAWIRAESAYLVGRRVAFDSQVLGDAERILKLMALNEAYSDLQSILPTHGLHPIAIYRTLCALVGRLSIFDEKRRPIDLPPYDHEDIGTVFAKVIQELRRLLGREPEKRMEKRYFKLEGRAFQVHLEPDWILDTSKLYIGVETTELTDAECDALMRSTNWKLGSGEQVGEVFRKGEPGLGMKPVGRIPTVLPSGVVYFEIERNPSYWRDVIRTHTLGLRFALDRGKFENNQMIALTEPQTGRIVTLQFAVFIVMPR